MSEQGKYTYYIVDATKAIEELEEVQEKLFELEDFRKGLRRVFWRVKVVLIGGEFVNFDYTKKSNAIRHARFGSKKVLRVTVRPKQEKP